MILAVIVAVVGIVLMIVGKNVTHYVPPNFNGTDDGFIDLMKMTGSVLRIAGIVIVAIAIVLGIATVL
ncbi:MAG: hypothetical protein Q4D51_00280 [Eubacteriales bacterium]|nr:hypothetical protein [Eubacteriales bacterium]